MATVVATLPAQSTSPHAYFDALVARPDHWKSYSLRSPGQLARPKDGGFAASNSDPLSVTYDPGNDLDPHAQDAAKVVIPPFNLQSGTQLVKPINATSLTLDLADLDGDVTKVTTALNAKGDQIRVGSEIMVTATDVTPLDRATGIVKLSRRGAYGTQAMPHQPGERVHLSGNSLANQIRVPFESFDGATWFITWDAYFTDSFLNNGIGNFKAFQLSSDQSIWLEPQTHFDGAPLEKPPFDPARHVAAAGRLRSYNNIGGPADWLLSTGNQLGPGITDNNPVMPTVNDFFIVYPNRWTRWWIRIEQRANDYDYVDLWMADEQVGPVQIYDRVPVSVRGGRIDKFYVEFNTSTAQLPDGRLTDLRDLVAYVRNIVILRDPPKEIGAFLSRPGAGPAVLPTARPQAPRNLRISSPVD
ncbi:hypothetical protein TBR22_A24210 [Luteitalea sp. TBR-22]|nr:hypothetical protein TBR22_A24210 [Luteitalea sp. TBR-22]